MHFIILMCSRLLFTHLPLRVSLHVSACVCVFFFIILFCFFLFSNAFFARTSQRIVCTRFRVAPPPPPLSLFPSLLPSLRFYFNSLFVFTPIFVYFPLPIFFSFFFFSLFYIVGPLPVATVTVGPSPPLSSSSHFFFLFILLCICTSKRASRIFFEHVPSLRVLSVCLYEFFFLSGLEV
ncbi:T. brucei spp.-specific protein [Trypanosoma brucei gambiense DAL972]|uniref:Uncharacterized protein n=1 Tax=Trypanosoma brucei gambiense (strain MHOM/CI/86/DAL972) TaxID=679716 RepID=C9ZHX6_TRYB9|nr:T. brucei spp.-specific protein [Trypanosoma brucei gambiense DAL972]CBH09093.1 T. brucei spp.-specific protein [Trypanosoma brucei gambiense DAL972]|eukprot:XP_011771534.1 T. brucei spp.-specific protein [Trypanosoma brucei gambiense DAL972]